MTSVIVNEICYVVCYMYKAEKTCNTSITNKKRCFCMKRDIRILLCICAAFGWWGFLYPELALTSDTYRVVDENGVVCESEEDGEWDPDDGIYWRMLGADSSQIRFRSKLFDSLAALTEYRRGMDESGK